MSNAHESQRKSNPTIGEPHVNNSNYINGI